MFCKTNTRFYTQECKVGLLCVVLLGIIDTGFAQSFSVQRVGNGKQAIILIPGFACSGEVWEQTVDSLQNNYSCYILTMPGFAGIPPEKIRPLIVGQNRLLGSFKKKI